MEHSHGDTFSDLTIQHLEFSSIIGGRWINPASILRIITESSLAANPLYERLGKEAGIPTLPTVFMKWRQMEFLPSYYDVKVKCRQQMHNFNLLNRKINIRRHILPPGRTSQRYESLVTDQATQKMLLVDSVVVVVVDPVTHKPVTVHPYYKEYFTPEKCGSDIEVLERLPPSCQKPYEVPKDAVCYMSTFCVNVQQIDGNNHVNQAEYCNFCISAIGAAFSKSIFGDMGSIFDYDLRRVSFLYMGECRFGENVDIVCWQDAENPMVFKFHVMNCRGLSCQAEFEFYMKNELKSCL